MRNLFWADTVRILKSKLIYVGLFLSGLGLIVETSSNSGGGAFTAGTFIGNIHSALSPNAWTALFTAIPIYLCVFGNELQSKSMQCVLGHGLTRTKLIVTKLLEAALFISVYFCCFHYLVFKCVEDEDFQLSLTQTSCLKIYICLSALKFFGYMVFSAMVLFLTGSPALGTMACVFFSLIQRTVFALAGFLSGTSLESYTFDGLIDGAYAGIEAGGIGWQLLPALMYLFAALAINILFFQRKEFEF